MNLLKFIFDKVYKNFGAVITWLNYYDLKVEYPNLGQSKNIKQQQKHSVFAVVNEECKIIMRIDAMYVNHVS